MKPQIDKSFTLSVLTVMFLIVGAMFMAGCFEEGMKILPPGPGEPEQFEVVAISYYRDWQFTRPLTDSVEVGATVYTKVVLAGNFEPDISFTVGEGGTQYRMRPPDVPYENLQSGDARLYENTQNTFICKYVVQTWDFGKMFSTRVGDVSGDPLQVVFFVYTPEEGDHEPVEQNEQDFTGLVCMPGPRNEPRSGGRNSIYAQPVPNATVTIVAGLRAGESVTTNQSGIYIFPNFEEDEIHLRVEKDFFEPKEVLAYKNGPTTLTNGVIPNFNQNFHINLRDPGTIVIGQRWPDEIRFILENVLIVHDLLYIEYPLLEGASGFYERGVVVVNSNNVHNSDSAMSVLAHEIAHAHQHAVVSPDGSGSVYDWPETPEAKAFSAAKEKDLKQFGRTVIDNRYPTNLVENAAEFCANFWGKGRWKVIYPDLKDTAPNRWKWAQEWVAID